MNGHDDSNPYAPPKPLDDEPVAVDVLPLESRPFLGFPKPYRMYLAGGKLRLEPDIGFVDHYKPLPDAVEWTAGETQRQLEFRSGFYCNSIRFRGRSYVLRDEKMLPLFYELAAWTQGSPDAKANQALLEKASRFSMSVHLLLTVLLLLFSWVIATTASEPGPILFYGANAVLLLGVLLLHLFGLRRLALRTTCYLAGLFFAAILLNSATYWFYPDRGYVPLLFVSRNAWPPFIPGFILFWAWNTRCARRVFRILYAPRPVLTESLPAIDPKLSGYTP